MKKVNTKISRFKKYIACILVVVLSVVAIAPFNVLAEEPSSEVTEHCYDDNSHSIPIGNMGQWFDSVISLKQYYNSVVNEWNNKVDSGQISEDEYAQNCPAGYEYWSCAYCGKWTGNFKYREVTEPSTDDTTECNHEWAYVALNGTSHYKYCTKCAEIIIEPCTYSSVVTAPTCVNQGYTTYTCIYCNSQMTGDYIPATGHNYVYVSNNDGTHHQICENCDAVTANENCVKTTVDGKTVCAYCGYVFETVTEEPSTEPSTEEPSSEPSSEIPTESTTDTPSVDPTEPSTEEPSSDTPTEIPSEEESSTDITVVPTEPSTEPSTEEPSSEPSSDMDVTEKPSETPSQPSEPSTGDNSSSEDVTEPTATTAVSEQNDNSYTNSVTNNNEGTTNISQNTSNPDIPNTGDDNNTTQKLIVMGVVLVVFVIIFVLVSKKMKKKG